MSPKSKVQSPKSKFTDQIPQTKIAVVCLFIALAVVACTNGKARRNEFNIAESKSYEASLFRQNCAICHGQEANGKEMDGKLIPSLRYGDAATKSEEEIYLQIKEGKLPMPSFKNQLTEEEIQKMVKFIRRDLQGKE
ncbi:MAG: c-type cytochrome [Pyrinomonadaceae bacterium]